MRRTSQLVRFTMSHREAAGCSQSTHFTNRRITPSNTIIELSRDTVLRAFSLQEPPSGPSYYRDFQNVSILQHAIFLFCETALNFSYLLGRKIHVIFIGLYKQAFSKKGRTFAIKTLLHILQHFKHCPLQSSPLYCRYTVPNVSSIVGMLPRTHFL